MRARAATPADAAEIARIYNQGIEDGGATFETRPRTADDVRDWLAGTYPVAVAEEDRRVLAFAASSAYSARACYAHVAEFSVYAAREARGRGAGRAALRELMLLARAAGLRKLTSKVFVENAASRKMLRAAGFREIGVHEKHGELGGTWHDVVLVEILL